MEGISFEEATNILDGIGSSESNEERGRPNGSAWETEDSAWETEDTGWETEDGFDLERVRQGVAREERHRALKQYLGWMVKQGYSRDDALEAILAWNRLNTPPLDEEVLKLLFDHYWSKWSPSESESRQS